MQVGAGKFWRFYSQFRVSGVDGGANIYKSHIALAIWHALKQAETEMPYPRHVVLMKPAVDA